MVLKIGIVDFGNSNILSVIRAIEKTSNAKGIRCKSPEQLKKVDKIILPGVGAFANGMQRLKGLGFDQAIGESYHSGTSILGICLGMQFMAGVSFEFGKSEGLDLISGHVEKLNSESIEGNKLVVPFVGWASLSVNQSNNKILDLSFNSRSFYFVHSYQFVPSDEESILATYEYGGNHIVAAVAKDNLLGVQFHPEKSGKAGLALIKKFIENL